MSQYTEQASKLKYASYRAKGAFIAGGAVNSAFTGRKIEDFDFYFKSQAAFAAAVEGAYDDGLWCCHASHRSVTFSDNGTLFQFMHFEFFEDADQVFDAFDFTVCMGAWDTDAKDFVLHPTFLTDCAERKLRFHAGTRFPIISALRVLKYQERGYVMAREEMLKLALACAAVDLNSWEDLRHQIGGIYGNRTAIVSEGEFSPRKAIDAISVPQEPVGSRDDEQPPYLASSEALLTHLGLALPEAA